MALRYQNTAHPNGRVPSYYASNKQYPGAYAQTDTTTRTSRRVHEGFNLTRNYGLDTVADDINSSQYSSPFYINGRYNSDNLTTQRGNSASVQGIKRLNDVHSYMEDFDLSEQETSIRLWQGKQIRFTIPFSGKVIGNIVAVKNTLGCRGILSIYVSDAIDGEPLTETAIDLCNVSQDIFEKFYLYSAQTISYADKTRHTLYVRMEIWDDLEVEPASRSVNPFNTGKYIEIASTGKNNHESAVSPYPDKNTKVSTTYNYSFQPSCPLFGLIYNDWTSVPVDRLDNIKTGATVSLDGYRYDLYACKHDNEIEMLVYDTEMNKFVDNEIVLDSRATEINVVQVTDTNQVSWVYYVDGYSPLQRFRIGTWVSESFASGSADNITVEIDDSVWNASDLGATTGTYVFTYTGGNWTYNESTVSLSTYGITLSGGDPAEGSTITVAFTVTEGGQKNVESIEFVDARPVVGASLLMFHNNRLFLSGFRTDPNLIQITSIEEDGPSFTLFPYRFYCPNRSPYDTSLNPITAMVEVASDQILICLKNGFSLYETYSSSSSTGLENNIPVQVSTFTDSAGVKSQGDVVNYKGVVYSFDEKEGIRRFTGSLWSVVPNTIDSHFDRVDMSQPRKIWGYANKLYFNYTDKIDGKRKALIWDQQMNYQSYPWFQDYDVPFLDVRSDDSEMLYGIHPDYPAVLNLYAEDTWRRLDSPIVFRRDSKYLSVSTNTNDMIVKRCHVKVLANSNRIWNVSLLPDKQYLTQTRGLDNFYRQPCWDTIVEDEPVENPFSYEDEYETNSVYRMSINNLRIQCSAIQMRVMTKTFRAQANLISTEVEVQTKPYL